MKSISENSKITIGLLVAVIGGIVWVSKMYFLAESNASVLEKVQQKQEIYTTDIGAIRESIVKIQSDLDYLKKNLEEK